jgi:hypothetical protein
MKYFFISGREAIERSRVVSPNHFRFAIEEFGARRTNHPGQQRASRRSRIREKFGFRVEGKRCSEGRPGNNFRSVKKLGRLEVKIL